MWASSDCSVRLSLSIADHPSFVHLFFLTLFPSLSSYFIHSMPVRYTPLLNPAAHPLADNELEAAFDDSDDEHEKDPHSNSTNNGYRPLSNVEPEPHRPVPLAPGSYDFENVDYDYTGPPPGEPPGPSARALPNEYGNSNGLVPSFSSVDTDAARRGNWFRRAATAILPSHYVQRLGLSPQVPTGAIGGGVSNDGVFANVTAKPSRPVRIQEGTDHLYFIGPLFHLRT